MCEWPKKFADKCVIPAETPPLFPAPTNQHASPKKVRLRSENCNRQKGGVEPNLGLSGRFRRENLDNAAGKGRHKKVPGASHRYGRMSKKDEPLPEPAW
uniref:Uncharacterized protein n=1 Tax=Bursaphelenchus xylophilus TaxID=6326 RepID=A0A1I7SCE2_BURXY